MKFKIYTLSDPITNIVWYIGKTKMELHERMINHMAPCNLKSNTYKNNWLKQLKNNGNTPLIEILDEIDTLSEANAAEIYWISQFKVWGFRLTNGTIGGDGGYTGPRILTEITKKKMSDAQRGKKLSKSTKNKISKAVSISLIGNKRAVGSKGWVGKTHTLISKNKMRINNPFRKSILMCDKNENIIKSFPSIREASAFTGIYKTTISRCCNPKYTHYKSGGGYIWKYELK